MLEAFPLLRLTDGQGLGREISEEQRVRNLLAAFLRENLLNLIFVPSEHFDHRIDEFLLGLGLIGLGDLEKLGGERVKALPH